MQADDHIGELAELYAAGALNEREHAVVEAHIGRCEACLRRTGEAEETVLALERRFKVPGDIVGLRTLSLTRSAKPFWTIAAMAAALIVGFVLPHPAQRPSPATLAMIQSHFAHAQFIGSGGAAKVLYARDRSWYYVIVEGSHRYEVYGSRRGALQRLGSTQPGGVTSELFVRASAPYDALDLRENGVVRERASIR
jgi:Putative zinc-finger